MKGGREMGVRGEDGDVAGRGEDRGMGKDKCPNWVRKRISTCNSGQREGRKRPWVIKQVRESNSRIVSLKMTSCGLSVLRIAT